MSGSRLMVDDEMIGVEVRFDDHLMEVLEKLGNPNKEYVNEQPVARQELK